MTTLITRRIGRLSDNYCLTTGVWDLGTGSVKRVAAIPVIDRSSTTDRVAGALRDMLFAGELSPGEPLREVSLSEGFGVARSTVREALQVLAGEGLVTRFPNRGVVVTELSERDIAEIFDARLVLESAGVRAGAAGADLTPVATALGTYAAAAQADDQVVATHAHLEFHTSLVALLGNTRLVSSADVLTADLRLALASVERARRNARSQVADHRRLLTLMRQGDEAAALAELQHHLAAAAVSVAGRVTGA
jgi:DNA-binding GntR family transcriptional regulator